MRKGPTRLLYVPALALGIAVLGGGLVTGTVLASLGAPRLAAAHLQPPPQYVVAIMPGHGGYDPGAISPFNGLKEKNVTLSTGLDLRRDLEADGVKVVMTRTTDTDVTVARAEQIAKASHAAVLLSLWVNDWTNDTLEGATVFMPHSNDLPLAQKLSTGLTAAIAPAGMGDRGTELLPQLWVHAPMPAVTIEVGFMSNEQDSRLLAEPGFRAQVAAGLTKGLLAFAPQIPQIDTKLLAYRKAEVKVVAAEKAASTQQAALRQMAGWAPLLLVLDGLLVLVMYREMIWRRLRRQAPAGAVSLRAVALVLVGVGSAGMDAAWRGITRARPRPERFRRTERPGRRPPTASRPRRPPREWRGRAAGVHPRRVTEMVQPDDRSRGSVFDDFSF
ncbi:MAG TPA: N-acetylmuramoyl-L-alanine amidase [Candidatus Dormibacteraeota bacterium]|nr:N-acetylmuramoyl-L-alanine amidase [Candidatus Dormibacteraeota bacterium]